jgi:uncharacterized membrane protein YgaE (UPF0421/DUF939 family)
MSETEETREHRIGFVVGQLLSVLLGVAASFIIFAIIGAWSHLYLKALLYGWEAMK